MIFKNFFSQKLSLTQTTVRTRTRIPMPIAGAGDIGLMIANYLVSSLRDSVISFTQGDDDADQWDEFNGGVNWIHNEFTSYPYTVRIQDDEMEYITSVDTVEECIYRLKNSRNIELYLQIYNEELAKYN